MIVSCAEDIGTRYLHLLMYLHCYLIVPSNVVVFTGCSIRTVWSLNKTFPLTCIQLRMIGAIPSLTHTPSWCAQEQFCLCLYEGKLIAKGGPQGNSEREHSVVTWKHSKHCTTSVGCFPHMVFGKFKYDWTCNSVLIGCKRIIKVETFSLAYNKNGCARPTVVFYISL
jgi:hypothetical protein